MEGWRIENICTLVAIVATIVGAYAYGAGHHAWWALLFLLNMNHIKSK